MSILGILGGIVNPLKAVADLVDNLHTSDEEKLTIKSEIARAEMKVRMAILKAEVELTKAQASIILAEAKGGLLTRNWRPILMLAFGSIPVYNFVVLHFLNIWMPVPLVPMILPDQVWTLLTAGITGYVGLRSAEKIATPVLEYLSKKREVGKVVGE